MGIRFYCPKGHKLNVKSFQAGRKGICPFCGSKVEIPLQSTRGRSKKRAGRHHGTSAAPETPAAPLDGPAAQPPGTMPEAEPAGAVPLPAAPIQSLVSDAPSSGSAPGAAAPWPLGFSAPVEASPPSSGAVAEPASGSPAVPGPADPLAEAGDVVWYVRPPSGGQFGPASRDVMRTWIQEGRVSADSLVWREGWRDWREASGVFPQLGAPQAAPVLDDILPGSATSATATPPAYRLKSRRQSQNAQLLVIGLLILAVIILSIVFLWVLLHEPAAAAEDLTPRSAARVTVGRHAAEQLPGNPAARPGHTQPRP